MIEMMLDEAWWMVSVQVYTEGVGTEKNYENIGQVARDSNLIHLA